MNSLTDCKSINVVNLFDEVSQFLLSRLCKKLFLQLHLQLLSEFEVVCTCF